MFIAPLTTVKLAGKVQKVADKNSEAVCGYLRTDAKNAAEKAKEIITTTANYFSPCSPIADPAGVKTAGNVIDFRF